MVVLLIIKKATTRPFLHHLDRFPLDFAPLMVFVDLRFCFAFFLGSLFLAEKYVTVTGWSVEVLCCCA